MQKIIDALGEEFVQKAGVVLVFIGLVVILKPLFNLVIFTFLFSYFFYSVQKLLVNKIFKGLKVNEKIITILLYLFATGIIALLITKFAPVAYSELIAIGRQVINFDFMSLRDIVPGDGVLFNLVTQANVEDWVKSSGQYMLEFATRAGGTTLSAFIAYMLSLFLVLGKDEMKEFYTQARRSSVGFIAEGLMYFGSNFMNSFGRVLQLQVTISFVNSVLSFVALTILGFGEVLGLTLMIFVLGLIPVAGVMISLIPLSIIAFKIGGIVKVLSVLIMIAILHFLESYALNPKLMAISTKLPVFMTFSILIVSEHIFGVWGLLIGLPLFIFLMDLFGIKRTSGSGNNKDSVA